MDKPPTKAKPNAEAEEAPDELDSYAGRAVIRAAETCRERFDDNPSRSTYQLQIILEALGRYPHLIDPVYRFMQSDKCPSRVPGVAPIVKIGGTDVRRPVRKKDGSFATDKDGLLVYQKIPGRPWEGPSMVRVTRSAIEDEVFKADPRYPLRVVTHVVRHLPPLLRADCKNAKKDPVEVAQKIADLLVDDDIGKRKQGWRDPEAVLRAILRELGHPRPDNVTRD
jgi:hypothetical protein